MINCGIFVQNKPWQIESFHAVELYVGRPKSVFVTLTSMKSYD